MATTKQSKLDEKREEDAKNKSIKVSESFAEVVADDKNQVVWLGDERIALGKVRQSYASGDKYIVYGYGESDLCYLVSSRYRFVDREKFNKFWESYVELKNLPDINLDSVDDYPRIESALASAVSTALEGDFEAAKGILEHARTNHINASRRGAKVRFTKWTIGMGLSLSVIGFIFFFRFPLSESEPLGVHLILAAAVAGGSLGALLSALGGGEKKQFELYAGKKAVAADSGLRLVYGVISAMVILLAVQSGIITSDIFKGDSSKIQLLLLAIAGGFMERWAIDIIRGIRPGKSEQEADIPTPPAQPDP